MTRITASPAAPLQPLPSSAAGLGQSSTLGTLHAALGRCLNEANRLREAGHTSRADQAILAHINSTNATINRTIDREMAKLDARALR